MNFFSSLEDLPQHFEQQHCKSPIDGVVKTSSLRSCVFFLCNSGAVGVWKAQQISLHGWLNHLHLRYGNAVNTEIVVLFFHVFMDLFSPPREAQPSSPLPALSIPHTFAVIANYSCHPLMGGEHINTLHFSCSCSRVVIGSWGLYKYIYYIQLPNLIIPY